MELRNCAALRTVAEDNQRINDIRYVINGRPCPLFRSMIARSLDAFPQAQVTITP
jgi:hypothetical protein